MRIVYIFIFFLLIGFNSKQLSSQNQVPEIVWQKTFGGSWAENAYSIVETNDGGFFIAGTTSSNEFNFSGVNGDTDYWTAKLDDEGNVEWQKSFGGSQDDQAFSGIQTADGGFIVIGRTISYDGDITIDLGGSDIWIVKLDTSGNMEWQKSLGGSDYDYAFDIRQTNDGGFIIAGMTESNDNDVSGNYGDLDYWIVKLNDLGNIEWQNCYGSNSYEYATSIEQTSDEGYIVVGYNSQNEGYITDNLGAYDYWILKLDSLGSIEWQKSYGGSDWDMPYSIKETSEGDFIVAGQSRSNDGLANFPLNNGNYDYWIIKLDNLGNVIWKNMLGGSGGDYANSIQLTYDKGFIIFGSSESNDGDVTGNHGGKDYWVVKLDSLGILQWQKSLGGSGDDFGRSILQLSDSSYVMIGSSQSNDGDITNYIAHFDAWIVKLGFPNGHIAGKLYNDLNSDCTNNNNEVGISSILIYKTQPYPILLESDSIGGYKIPIFSSGIKSFEPLIPDYLQLLVSNPCSTSYSIQIDNVKNDTSGFDFGFEVEPCPLLLIDITSNRRRPCFTSTTITSYRNDGFADETNVEIVVELPDSVYPISASEPYTINALGQLVFDISDLDAQESGMITIMDSMACELSLSNTQACSQAWISPANICYNNLVNPLPWDSSNIVINGGIQLDSLGDTCYRFVIANIGADMEDSLSYSIYSGVGFIQSDSLLLGNNDSIVIVVCGVDYAQVLVNQHINNPVTKIAFFEPPTTDTTIISIYEFINVDQNLESAIECLTVVNAYDPNDKNATPLGWGAENYVSLSTLLDYKIRFQNTGNDTAYTVEIIDTIDIAVFDVSRLILGGSSHPYTFEVSGDSGQVVFHFIFENINLLDSFTNEPLSHGFVNFKIGAYGTIPEGTVANNFADIYFDFNPAIRTNTSMVTLQDTIPEENYSGITVKLESQEVQDTVGIKDFSSLNLNWNIYPNPTSSSFHIELSDFNNTYKIEIQNVMGQVLYNKTTTSNQTLIDTKSWSSGIYNIVLKDENGVFLGNKKIVLNR